MNIEIRCNNCDKNLAILNETIVPGTNSLRLEVAPCKSKGCTICDDCEDMELLKILQEELKEVKKKLAYHEAIP